ncbi:uncharacterized protein LOC123528539 [Mercenaria mercenaria]|uniref:uncharacterized protein LOC123528539 n=1 Tax=Mercenaria mercenaria TaxID=6596 RepID=UPI00234E8D49|nr:uncharacterized protein LOC123528539 [Mercenaria mercenaria]XP_053378024.1 uncharacterized protein LOC123528539 [Mercenaria mercenaria]
MWQHILWTFVTELIIYVYTASAVDVNNGACVYRKFERAGDVKFLVVAGIRENDGHGVCGNPSRTTFEQIVAMEWIISLLNGNGSRQDSFIPGVTIGYDIYDNCDNEDLTTDLLYSEHIHEMDCNTAESDSPVYIGALSLTTPNATNTMARLLHPLPVFRPLMSSPALQSRDYSNLLQSVVSFREEATAIAKMLSSIGWNFIVVVHTHDTTDEAVEFSAIARSNGICINFTGAPEKGTVQNIFKTMTNMAYQKSLAVVYFGSSFGAKYIVKESTSSQRPLGSKIHWVFTSKFVDNIPVANADSIISLNLHDPIADFENNEFMAFFNKLSVNSSLSPLQGLIQKHNFVLNNSAPYINPYPTVDSILSMINSVKDVWDTVCNQSPTVADCSAFQDAIQNDLVEKIKGVKVPDKISKKYLPTDYNRTRQYLQDGTQKYETLYLTLYTHLKNSTIGSFTDNKYRPAVSAPVLPSSACNKDCNECQGQLDIRYSYLHGDYLILGLFSLRQYGDTPYTCGHIRRGTNDIVTVSSFFQSVLARRNQTNKTFGAIAIDDCYNGLNTSNYLAQLFSKQKTLKDPSDSNREINFDNVISVVGALSSSVTLIVADLLTSVNLPMISYSASSPDLDNKNRYPYFLRTVPSDTLQVQGMIAVVLELGVSHVGLVYIDDAYGQGGKLRLQQEASSRNICVENPISVRQDMSEEYVEIDVIKELYEQQVRVVLFFAIDSIAQQILDVMEKKFGSFQPLVFISSEGWGSNLNLLTQRSLGSVVFNIAAQFYNSESYKNYLQTLRPWKENENRWISRYFEDYNQCDNMTSFEKTFIPKICGKGTTYKNTLDGNTTKSLSEDQRYFHTMLSVFAVTDGFKKFCDSEVACSPSAVKNKLNTYFGHIKSTKYGSDIPIFNEDGNGHIGFTIHNIQLKMSAGPYNIDYEMVGTYQNGKLELTKQPKFYNDRLQEESLQDQYAMEIDCFKMAACSNVCPLPVTSTPTTKSDRTETTPEADEKDSSLMTMTIVFGVFMAVLLVALVFVVVILVRILNRQAKQLSDRGDSGGHTISMSDAHSVYDEPGSMKRRDQFDNLAFMADSASLRSGAHTPSTHAIRIAGSVSSLNVQQPVQYAHIRQMSNPDIQMHHIRQISNQELRSGWFDSLERPTSTLSAPAYKPHSNQRSPFVKRNMYPTGTKQKPYKQSYSPKTPHSAPTEFRQPVVYRPRAQSSPRFRYPSSSGEESHYAMPKLDSEEEIVPQRKMGVSDDDIHEHFEDGNVSDDPNLCNVDSYLYPHPCSENEVQNQSEPESKITYLTAKDLVTSESEDEEDISLETDDVIQYVNPESQNVFNAQTSSLKTQTPLKQESTSSLISPTDNEVRNINFPPAEKVFHPIESNTTRVREKPKLETQQRGLSGKGTVSQSSGPPNQATGTVQAVAYQKNNSRNSITDVPDVIKHGAYEEDGVFII